MSGILYGVGVGPGDPEMMTLKAVRLIQENEVIALPGAVPKETVAYEIAVQAVPELAEKELVAVHMPMSLDWAVNDRNHKLGAKLVAEYLEKGQNVVYLTLGDSSIYSTFTYLQKEVEALGYKTQIVSGITSFCAAAARMNLPLAEWNEPLHIIPAIHRLGHGLEADGNFVLMKSGRKMNEVKKVLAESGKNVVMVENCGMPSEKIYNSVEEIPDDAGYYSLIIAKEPK